MLVFVLSGCFGELFASRTVYLATEYRIEHPRIVAMALDPPRVPAPATSTATGCSTWPWERQAPDASTAPC